MTTDLERATKGSVAQVNALIQLISGIQAYLRWYKIDFSPLSGMVDSSISGHFRSLHTQSNIYPYKIQTTTNLKKSFHHYEAFDHLYNLKAPVV